MSPPTPMRRVAGYHDIRMDGIADLVIRARGASVLDIGCNRGMVGFEMANNGAKLVHGCDIYEPGIITAREVFADLRSVEAKFEVFDVSKGGEAFKKVFGDRKYDITLMLATYHKLRRTMSGEKLQQLMVFLGNNTHRYFGWRGTSEQHEENEWEIADIDRDLKTAGLKRVHTSYLSFDLGVAAIWERL